VLQGRCLPNLVAPSLHFNRDFPDEFRFTTIVGLHDDCIASAGVDKAKEASGAT